MFPYRHLPAINSFCATRLDEAHLAGDSEAAALRARLHTTANALRALGPETWPAVECDIRDIAARFTSHPDYPELGLTGDR